MYSVYTLKDVYTNGYQFNLLNVISVISILCGIAVIVAKNPIVSVLFLIGLFFSIASYLMTLGLNFIGLSYLLVYVGAVSILFLFILMLINVRISELVTDNNNSIILALLLGLLILTPIYNKGNYNNNKIQLDFNSNLGEYKFKSNIELSNLFGDLSNWLNNLLYSSSLSNYEEYKDTDNIYFVTSKL